MTDVAVEKLELLFWRDRNCGAGRLHRRPPVFHLIINAVTAYYATGGISGISIPSVNFEPKLES